MQDSIGLPPMYVPACFGQDVELPAYSVSSDAGRSIFPSALSPTEPAFNGSAEFRHDLPFKGKNSKSSASLVLYGDAAFSKQFPTYLEDSNLQGTVKVNLENSEAVNTVVVSLRGQIVSGASTRTFFESSQTLWPHSSPLSNSNSPTKLEGEHEWPFSMNIPKEVPLSTGSKDASRNELVRLPHNCLERRLPAGIEYQVILRFTRGLFKTDYRIIAPFGYIPIIRPDLPSPRRQLAYQENTAIPGPLADPEGWYSLPSRQIAGRLFNRQSAEATCTLSLALPLSYTRGSVIPLHLVIQSYNTQALEALSSPRAIVCRLRRSLRYLSSEDLRENKQPGKVQQDHSELATWWSSPADVVEKETFRRTLHGEISLPPDLKPTTDIGKFHLEYSVVLFSFDSTSFQTSSSHSSQDVLLTHPVRIATAFASGPLPRTYTPESSSFSDFGSGSSQGLAHAPGFF
ncbi:hypothetical protein GYMLUDRAFT_48099 [Collybiopsis luxurians FD-317 M1]|uniref:Arrestin-like N-terminal domain-containing protein n=1 Tax=Collybiopsis luxurians FD-317 M1 TaxID=944289 RepID=A0A0D0CAT3_9AGAR|nr:hypothetical protein GYMLUDRAFT_48099 [Collybiopsis luxurians FD-317 M1]